MSDPIYEYNVWCNEEAKYTSQWNTVAPTICTSTVSHTGARDIDTTKSIIVRKVSEDLISVKDQYSGYFQSVSLEIAITGASGMHNIDVFSDGSPIVWPMDIIVWQTTVFPTSNMIGDYMSIVAAPNTTVGYILPGAATGATVVYTQQTATNNPNIIRGVDIAITDGVNYQDLGRITGLNSITGTVSFENPLLRAYSAFSLIKVNIRTVKKIKFYSAGSKEFARKGSSGKRIPSGTPIRLEYYNNNGEAKTVCIDLEYYYDR